MREVKQPHGGTMHVLEKGETANPNGRPKTLVNSIISTLKEEGYEEATNSQIVSIISLMLNLDKARIKALADDNNSPIYVQRIARRLYGATDKEIGDFMDKQLDRAFGKPKQPNELTGPNGTPLEIGLSLGRDQGKIKALLGEINGTSEAP